MILTDGVHLVSDMSPQELHDFARRIGLKRHWFHRTRTAHLPHYDLMSRMKEKAIQAGAELVDRKELVQRAFKEVRA